MLAQVPPLSEEKLYPKERALIDLVAAERLEGRRVLVYVTHTGTRDITGRMDDILTRHGFRVAVMKADAVAPDRREAWVADRVEEGIDVLICHPRLVQTGLDLVSFPTIAWYETDYSVYTMRQASRRSWRIGQTQPVRVVFMSYRSTLQADALKLVAKKLQSSLAVEGELPEDGLAAYGDEGDDLMMALARKIVSGRAGRGRDGGGGLRAGQGRRERGRGAAGGRGLETGRVNGNGVNGHPSTASASGPTVELVPVNGHDGNGHHGDEVRGAAAGRCSPGRSSWTLSRTGPRVAGRKLQPASMSIFEWAFEQEREREAVLRSKPGQ